MADQVIPEEIVEKATQALRDAGFVDPDDDTVPTFAASEDMSKYSSRFDVWVPARDAVVAVLSAALAGRQVVDTPDDGHCAKCGQPFSDEVREVVLEPLPPFDARDRIERVLRIQGVASGSVEGAAHRIMRALTGARCWFWVG